MISALKNFLSEVWNQPVGNLPSLKERWIDFLTNPFALAAIGFFIWFISLIGQSNG